MKRDEWPISPTFISLIHDKTEESADFNNDGIYYPDYIRGFLADLSHDRRVQNALSMFQVVPKDFIPLDENNPSTTQDNDKSQTVLNNIPIDNRIIKNIGENRKIIRIESGTFIENGVCCGHFRTCDIKATEFCYRQDGCIGIFADERLYSLQPYTCSYSDQLQKLLDEFNKEEPIEAHKLKLKTFKKRIYVHYTCKISSFEENMFPIYAKGKLVACLMLGQMNIENYDKNIAFKNCQEIIGIDLQNCSKIRKKLPKKKLTEKQWTERLDAIVSRIDIYEKRLDDKINYRSEIYINNKFSEIKYQFSEHTKNIRIKDSNTSVKFFKALSEALTSIHDVFDANAESFIRVFALPMDNASTNYIPIGWYGKENIDYSRLKEHYTFDVKALKLLAEEFNISKLSKDQMQIIIDKTASKEIKKKYNKEKDLIKIEKLIGDGISFIIWKRHTNSKVMNDKDVFQSYKNALISFYSVAFQSYSYLRGTKMEYMLETTIRTTSHESAHFILPALDIVEKKMSIIPPEMVMSAYAEEYKKMADVYEHYKENVIELLNQLSEINTRPSLIFKDIILEKSSVQVFPLLYKMKKMMDDIASDRHQKITYSQKDNYVEVDIDPVYFNHALFNLIDNAIKYGYEGSNIYINMYKNIKELVVEVISFGREIEDGDRIYKLFERGVDYKEIKGMGIGMFIIEKICNAHGGSIVHKSEPISLLNLPVLASYWFFNRDYFLRELGEKERNKISQELANLNPKIIKEAVFDYKFIKYPNVFANRIFYPTYRNSFKITLPI